MDYQDLLARPDFDAVWIATPDHWHSPMALDALAEDIYLEEPMAYTVEEERRITDAVEGSGRVLQIGSLDVSEKHYHQEPPRRLRREVWSAGRPKLAVPSGSLKRFPNALLLVGRTVPTEGKRL